MKVPRPIGRMFVACLAIGVASACSLLIDVSGEQCTTDADCAARGASFAAARCVRSACTLDDGVEAGPVPEAGSPDVDAADASPPVDPRYLCLGKHPAPTPTKATAAYMLTLTDLITQKALPGLRVKLCTNLTDPSCAVPAATTQTDDAGVARLTIDLSKGAFDGYVDVDPETADGGSAVVDGGDTAVYMPSRIYYTSIPIAADRTDDYQLLQFGTLNLFGSLFSAKADFTKGAAFIIAEDCSFTDSASISLTVDQADDGGTHAFYIKNDQPSTTATETDVSGIAGFVNLPTGNRSFTTELSTTKQKVGSVNGYVRPGTIMFAKIGPAFTP